MSEQRLEKKFVYNLGDESFNHFLITGMFKETYPKRIVNSIYFDTEIFKDVWDNINGFGDRKKIRVRWYNQINNSKVQIEEKKKIGFVTQKRVQNIGTFKNFKELNNFLDNEKFFKLNFFLEKKINLKKTLFIQYERKYYELPNKKLRVTLDKKLKLFQNFPSKFIEIDKTILELKYNVNQASYVNQFIKNSNLNNRNQKFSKYVNSFIELNDSGFL